ncbi:hypothetical protein CGJ47_24130 [Vibrio parahaemolyticus]|nr:hypothetical protein CGJ47_24130 [Vibrio parahaemolyticus]
MARFRCKWFRASGRYLNSDFCSGDDSQEKIAITRRLRRIHNAWRFQVQSGLVFKVQWFRFGGRRCSPLNAALCSYRLCNERFD